MPRCRAGGPPMTRSAKHDADIVARTRERFPTDAESRRQLADAVRTAASALGEMVGAFFRQAGMSKEEVAATFEQLRDASLARDLEIEANSKAVWRQTADAVTLWWRDPQYLDDEALPRPLPESGPAPSVESLIAATVSPEQRVEAKALLRRTCVTELDGLWRYCEEDTGLLRLSAEHGVDRLMLCMGGMLTTYLDNALRRRDLQITKNFDQTALVQEFPLALVPELRVKLMKRLMVELQSVDEVLSAGVRRGGVGPVAMVGVTMFMHVSEPKPRSKRSPDGDADTTGNTRRAARGSAKTKTTTKAPRK
jgi:hypothetical protein